MENEQNNLSNKEIGQKLDVIAEELRRLSKVTGMQLTRSFFLGLVYYLGATVGLAIFITLFGYFINVFGGLPVVGNWFIAFGKFLHR